MSLESQEADNLRQRNDQTTLYEQHGRTIFAYLRLHLRSLEDTEDLLLEVFLAALEHDNLSSLLPQEQLAWLRRVAHNKLANVYRHRDRHPQAVLDTIVESVWAPDTDTPEQFLLGKEERKQLEAAIKTLPLMQQHMLQLRYSDGLSCAEIALLLQKREGAVRKMLSRSIISLRQIYRQTEGAKTC